MPFLLLLFLMLVCVPDNWPVPVWIHGVGECAVLTAASVVALVGAAFLMSRWLCRQLRRNPERRFALLRRYGAWRFYHLGGVFTVYSAALYAAGWGWAVKQFCAADPRWLAVSELILLAPFLTTLLLTWACFYDVERAFNAAASTDMEWIFRDSTSREAVPFWGRWGYVLYLLRHNLGMICVPLALMILQKDVHRLVPDLPKRWPWLTTVLGTLVFASVFIVMPWVIRVVLGLRPLPAGPLRDRLLSAADRLRFRCSDLLLWDTRFGVANAMVIGILPWLRYVLFTDRLLSELTPDEVEAVLGHEVGHVKHHHMLYYVGFLLVSGVVVAGSWDAALSLPGLNTWLTDYRDLEVLPFLALFGCYFFVVFGFLSRRCERQADIYGCKAVSCARTFCQGHELPSPRPATGQQICPTGIRTFIDALEKVASVNGISRDRPGWFQSWQHSTIARRVEFLQRMLNDPTLEPRFQRRVGLVKWALFVGLATALVVLGFTFGWDVSLAAL